VDHLQKSMNLSGSVNIGEFLSSKQYSLHFRLTTMKSYLLSRLPMEWNVELLQGVMSH